jgi:hypothetical protein
MLVTQQQKHHMGCLPKAPEDLVSLQSPCT